MGLSGLVSEIVAGFDRRGQSLIKRSLSPHVGAETLERNGRLQQTKFEVIIVARSKNEITLLVVRSHRLWPKKIKANELLALRKITKSKSLRVVTVQEKIELREVTLAFGLGLITRK